MAEKTLFEHILSGDIPSHKVGSGEGWYAFLDIFPRREGHTLVIPTTPVSRMRDLSTLERSQLMEGVVEVQRLLTIKFNTTDYTVVVHDGPLAGQEVPHVHIHILPRTENASGKTLASMWPHQSQEIDHDKLRVLASELQTEGE
jgi:histidine triad (HIT) family protein